MDTFISQATQSDQTRVSAGPCTAPMDDVDAAFGWNNVIVLNSAVLGRDDVSSSSSGTKTLMTSLFKRRVSGTSTKRTELTVTAELRVVGTTTTDACVSNDHSIGSERLEEAVAAGTCLTGRNFHESQASSYSIGVRADLTATPGRTMPASGSSTTVSQQATQLSQPSVATIGAAGVSGRVLNALQSPFWPISSVSPSAVSGATPMSAGMEGFGWQHAADMRAMPPFSPFIMPGQGNMALNPAMYGASPFAMYGMTMGGPAGYSMPFMPSVQSFEPQVASEGSEEPENDDDASTSGSKPRYSHRPAYRCNLCGELKRGHDCPLKQIEVAPRKERKTLATAANHESATTSAMSSSKKRRTGPSAT